jgi:hypothetical protein
MAPAPTAAGAPAFLPFGADATSDQKAQWAKWAYAGNVREIGTEARDLTESLAGVTKALAVVDAGVRKQGVAKQLAELQRVLPDRKAVVARIFATLNDLSQQYAWLLDWSGDELLETSNLWGEALAHIPGEKAQLDDIALQSAIADASAKLSEVIWHAALVTLPSRLHQHLSTMWVGDQLDFAATFADELPDPASQRRMLVYLAGHPDAIEGVVDVDAGVIYKRARQFRWWLASYALLIAVGIAGVGLVKVLVDGIPLIAPSGWFGLRPEGFGSVLSAYAFLILGALFHIGVEAIKHNQRSTPGSFTAIGDWLAWIHVRVLALLGGILMIWVTLVFLAKSLPADQLTWETALFAGYGIDSIFGLVVTRFDAAATLQVGSITSLLSRQAAAGSAAKP